ncbi:hypothetical protein [Citrobacter youngae]|uniref:hypothetical protein n=1 Tax=Citrobacter youngae TaxID=133448 RepID=UPI000E14643D|nr:hypothetical protein [Citrobacter youngae]SUX97359.1 Uncharacterised protein [Citrobacter youngae]
MTTNHPAHGPVSLERLHQISEILSKVAAQSDGGNLGYAMADAVKVIEVAISAFGAEPVAYMTYKGYLLHAADPKLAEYSDPTPLYDAPPATVVPEPATVETTYPDVQTNWRDEKIYADGFNACRAAMLQTGNHTEQHLDMVDHSGDANESVDCRLTFDQWLSQQNEPIDVDCGCVSTEAFYHWLRVAYESGKSPVTPDGLALVPKRLTAENGAKGVLSGEFSETKFINCPECFGDDECETCDGSGRIEITVPVSWTNIKAIWAKGVEHFEAAPQQENI